MCLGIPGQIVEMVDETLQIAKVAVAGVKRAVPADFGDVHLDVVNHVARLEPIHFIAIQPHRGGHRAVVDAGASEAPLQRVLQRRVELRRGSQSQERYPCRQLPRAREIEELRSLRRFGGSGVELVNAFLHHRRQPGVLACAHVSRVSDRRVVEFFEKLVDVAERLIELR